MASVAIREYLKNKGIKNIGWQNGQVTVGGKSFYKPTSVKDGRSYATPEALDAALATLKGTQSQAPKPASNIIAFGAKKAAPAGTVPVREYLVNRGYDPSKIGWQSGTITLGDRYGINPSGVVGGRAYAPGSTIEAALRAMNYQSPAEQKAAARKEQIDSLVAALTQAVNQPFNYNPEEDPRYQAAQKLAEAQAQRASQRAMEELNARGILNSTVTSDRLGQIQQQSAESVASMIPGLYQSALQERQSQLGNLGDLANVLMKLYQTEQGQAQQPSRYDQALATEVAQQAAQEKLDWDRRYKEAGLTGMWQGQPTLEGLKTQYQIKKPYYKPSTGGGGPGKNESLNQLAVRIHELKNQGYSKEDVKNIMYQNAGELGQVKIGDVIKLVDDIYGDNGDNNSGYGVLGNGQSQPAQATTPEEIYKQALKKRPWWQKFIDILPGKQFR